MKKEVQFDHSIKVGLSFGLTSGIITTTGLMVGLNSGTHSRLAVLGGIITIAVADAMSDALGIHISEESENKHTQSQIWASTLSTFLAKFLIAITFLVPVILLALDTAVIVSVVWGLLLLTAGSIYLAKQEKMNPWEAVFEHIGIAGLVIVVTFYLGKFISLYFGSV